MIYFTHAGLRFLHIYFFFLLFFLKCCDGCCYYYFCLYSLCLFYLFLEWWRRSWYILFRARVYRWIYNLEFGDLLRKRSWIMMMKSGVTVSLKVTPFTWFKLLFYFSTISVSRRKKNEKQRKPHSWLPRVRIRDDGTLTTDTRTQKKRYIDELPQRGHSSHVNETRNAHSPPTNEQSRHQTRWKSACARRHSWLYLQPR